MHTRDASAGPYTGAALEMLTHVASLQPDVRSCPQCAAPLRPVTQHDMGAAGTDDAMACMQHHVGSGAVDSFRRSEL
jgi:hypothetical protein